MAQIIKEDVKVGDIVVLVRPFKIFRLMTDGSFDICDDDGNCLSASQKELFISKTNQIHNMKAMKDAVLTVAKDLVKAKNTVTTLEIKVQLRRDYPYYFWDQNTVSKYMDGLAGDGLFTYTDNGTYRTYSLVGAPTVTPSVAVTKTIVVKAGKGTANTVSVAPSVGVKVRRTKIDASALLNFAASPQFVSVVLANGTTVSRSDIKSQKKSPVGYITPKLGKIKSIVVGTTQYNVK